MGKFDCLVIGPGLGRDPFLLVCNFVSVLTSILIPINYGGYMNESHMPLIHIVHFAYVVGGMDVRLCFETESINNIVFLVLLLETKCSSIRKSIGQ